MTRFLLRHGSMFVGMFAGACFGMWFVSLFIDIDRGGQYASASLYTWIIFGCGFALAGIATLLERLEKRFSELEKK